MSRVGETPQLRALDHLYLSVRELERSERFYDPVMESLGFKKGVREIAGAPHVHYFNPWMQLTLREAHRGTPAHDPYAPGLHHVCFQVLDRASVDECHRRLEALRVESLAPQLYPEYTPDYYATQFRDPDGIRIEIVARTAAREKIATRWSELRVFVNPVAELERREAGREDSAHGDD